MAPLGLHPPNGPKCVHVIAHLLELRAVVYAKAILSTALEGQVHAANAALVWILAWCSHFAQ